MNQSDPAIALTPVHFLDPTQSQKEHDLQFVAEGSSVDDASERIVGVAGALAVIAIVAVVGMRRMKCWLQWNHVAVVVVVAGEHVVEGWRMEWPGVVGWSAAAEVGRCVELDAVVDLS